MMLTALGCGALAPALVGGDRFAEGCVGGASEGLALEGGSGCGGVACAGEGADVGAAPAAPVSGASSGARRITYRTRATGSTALYPSGRSSIENWVMGPAVPPPSSRALWRAACHAFASTTKVSGGLG
jgi:hypothetical protein